MQLKSLLKKFPKDFRLPLCTKWLAFWVIITTVVSLFVSYWIPAFRFDPDIYQKADEVPKHSVALLLGTTSTIDWKQNTYFKNRIQAVKDLYQAGRIDCVLVSWDNSTEYYNESRDMQNALLSQGIPPERIFLDYAWFRTLDSVVRAKEVFGQTQLTIVSQEFHLERALAIASHFGIDAVWYSALDVPLSIGLKTRIREIGSRIALYYDLYIADTAPKFLWNSIRIPIDASERPTPEKICYPR